MLLEIDLNIYRDILLQTGVIDLYSYFECFCLDAFGEVQCNVQFFCYANVLIELTVNN